VTTGERPHVEGVRMYTHDLGVLLKELLQGRGDAEMLDASAASDVRACFRAMNPSVRAMLEQGCTASSELCLSTRCLRSR
jgi:hypothetical protein